MTTIQLQLFPEQPTLPTLTPLCPRCGGWCSIGHRLIPSDDEPKCPECEGRGTVSDDQDDEL